MKINQPAPDSSRKIWRMLADLPGLILLLLLLVIGPGVSRLHAQTADNFKWNQPPVPAAPGNLYYGWNEPSVWGSSQIAADDFVCTTTNPVTSIRWWGSFMGWRSNTPPPIKPESFQLTIWKDKPPGTGGDYFSHPDIAVWQATAINYRWEFVGWDFDPRTQEYEACFKFEYDLPASQWFTQPKGVNIYWLSIAAFYPTTPSDNSWGWKTRPRDPTSTAPDAAVRIFAPTAPALNMLYEFGEPIYWPTSQDAWDLAFELISSQTTVAQKWLQPPDLTSYGIDINDSALPAGFQPYVLADDFLCVSTGPLTDITIWGSWFNDILPNNPTNVAFTLVIHRDIPAIPPNTFSRPGPGLWTNVFLPGQFGWQIEQAGQMEGWMDPPSTGTPQADRNIHRYDFQIDPTLAFIQQGNAANPMVYWLEVQARPLGTLSSAKFGWKTSDDQWNDTAVWANGYAPYSGTDWKELIYPPGNPYVGTHIGLAFSVGTSTHFQGLKWSQPPAPYTPSDAYNGWNEWSVYGYRQIVADDWVCTNANPVTDIHWWGSFLGWNFSQNPPLPQGFDLAIWTDVPKGSTGFSHPGQVIWATYCTTFNWRFVGWDIDPRDPGAAPEACFKFDFDLPQTQWFYQDPLKGTNIYWLSIAAEYGTQLPSFPWGWKTRPRDPKSPAPDDAVKIFSPLFPFVGTQFQEGAPLEFPTGVSWDCAFALTTQQAANCVDVICPSDIINRCGGPNGATNYYTAYATNRCTGQLLPAECFPPSGSVFPLGTTQVCCTNILDKWTNFCCFSVTVIRDTIPPVITCPPNIVTNTDAGQCSKSNVTFTATATDNCGGQTLDGPCLVADNGSGTVYLPPVACVYRSSNDVMRIIDGLPPGTTAELDPTQRNFTCEQHVCVDCFETDDCDPKNGATEQFRSTLQFRLHGTGDLAGWERDISVPNVLCQVQSGPRNPGDPIQSFDTALFMMQGQLPLGDPDFDLLRITAGSGFGMPSPGHTTLTRQPDGRWTVDSFFDITYRIDFIGAPGGHLAGRSGSTTATIRMVTTAPASVSSVPVVCTPPSGASFPKGVTTVTCTATDASGNSNSCTFTVSIRDLEPPAVVCPSNIIEATDPGQCSKSNVTFTATATDNCGGQTLDGPCLVEDNGSGTVYLPPVACVYRSSNDVMRIIDGLPPGTTAELDPTQRNFTCEQHVCVDCFETDDCDPKNGATEQFRSTLQFRLHGTGDLAGWERDVSVPSVFSQVQSGPRNPGDPVQSFGTDLQQMQGQITGDPDFDLLRITAGTGFGMPSPGHTTLSRQPDGRWMVDSFFDITYRIDFVGAPGGHLAGRSGSTTATIRMVTTAPASVSNVPVVCNPPSGASFPKGVTTVTCTATDQSGNSASCSFTVTVRDLEPPHIICPSNICVMGYAPTGAVVNYSAPATSDNCDLKSVECVPPSGVLFPLGVTVVTCLASDTSGNSSSCSFLVSVAPPCPSLQIFLRPNPQLPGHYEVWICWPADNSDCVLQYTDSLNTPILWNDWLGPIIFEPNGTKCVRIPDPLGMRFFRLHGGCSLRQ